MFRAARLRHTRLFLFVGSLQGLQQPPLRVPRVHPPWHRSRPRFLPQGEEGNDAIVVDGYGNTLRVCPASALPTAPDLVFFRRAATASTRARPAAPVTPSLGANPKPDDGRRRGRAPRSRTRIPFPPHRLVPWRREEPGRDPSLLKNIDQRPLLTPRPPPAPGTTAPRAVHSGRRSLSVARRRGDGVELDAAEEA